MKLYITTRFATASEAKEDIEALCQAVRTAGIEDFVFVRDVENYQHVFDDPKDLWQRTNEEILACDALLVDISDQPTGGRVVECGIAFALNKPVIVIAKQGTQYKQIFEGIAAKIIFYDVYADIIKELQEYSS